MHLAGGAVIFGAFIVLYFPYGDTPGAARKSSLSHDERASIHYARGTR